MPHFAIGKASVYFLGFVLMIVGGLILLAFSAPVMVDPGFTSQARVGVLGGLLMALVGGYLPIMVVNEPKDRDLQVIQVILLVAICLVLVMLIGQAILTFGL